MLVLGRKLNQRVRIGDVVVTVLAVGGNRVRLGIEAPPEVRIVRDEATDTDPQSTPQAA